MLAIFYHKKFQKDYKKMPLKVRELFKERLRLFRMQPFHPLLKNHPLRRELKDYWAFSVTGDIRVIYEYLAKNTIALVRIGSHNQVY